MSLLNDPLWDLIYQEGLIYFEVCNKICAHLRSISFLSGFFFSQMMRHFFSLLRKASKTSIMMWLPSMFPLRPQARTSRCRVAAFAPKLREQSIIKQPEIKMAHFTSSAHVLGQFVFISSSSLTVQNKISIFVRNILLLMKIKWAILCCICLCQILYTVVWN